MQNAKLDVGDLHRESQKGKPADDTKSQLSLCGLSSNRTKDTQDKSPTSTDLPQLMLNNASERVGEAQSNSSLLYENIRPDTEFIGPENKSLDFRLVDSSSGVSVFQNGRDFIVVANLSKGATINLVPGDIVNTARKSVYGGPDPDFKRMTPEQALNKERKIHPDAMCVVNAEFFSNLPKSTAPLAFPLKVDGKLLSEGFATVDKHQGNRLTLELGPNYAKMIPFDNNNITEFRNIKEENAIVSLRPSVNIDGSSARQVGRTYVGLAHPDAEGKNSEFIIFVSSASTQPHAEAALKKFGATSIMMLDGGNSSQFLCNNHHYVETTRTIPQYLSVTPAAESKK